MFKQRVITSIILLLLTWITFFNLPNASFIAAICLLFLIGIWEISQMYHFDLINQIGVIILFILLSYIVLYTPFDINDIIRIVGSITWCLIVPAILIIRPQTINKPILISLIILIFVPALYSLVTLKEVLGPWQIISLMAVAWVSDISAYFVGRKFGHTKLAPSISPGKSIEGAIGGIIASFIYLALLKYFNLAIYLYNYLVIIKFSLILTTVGIVGDLFESWLKRVAKVKDSGTILPGHGGVLDRIDSLIAVVTISFVMIRGVI